jgi:hypothetical protein
MALYSYGYLGILETAGCFLSYFLVFWLHGLPPGVVYDAGRSYFNTRSCSVLTYGGKTYTCDEQTSILGAAQSAYFLGVDFTRCSSLLVQNSKSASADQRNFPVRNFPFMSVVIGDGPTPGWAWLFPLPVAVLMIAFDIVRKWLFSELVQCQVLVLVAQPRNSAMTSRDCAVLGISLNR